MDLARDIFDSVMREMTTDLAQATQVQEEIQNAVVEARSEDDLIHLTVGPPGHLRSLKLDPRAKRLSLDALAEKIVEMVNNASVLLQEEISNRVQEMMPQLDSAQLISEYTQMNEPRY